jgi:hypothetical protein
MSLLTWLLAGFGTVLVIALVGMAWILVRVHMRPGDLRDEDEPCEYNGDRL